MSIHLKEGVYSKQYCLWNWLFLEMVQLMQRRQSLKYSVIGNKTFKVKDINYIRNLLYTWTKLQKDTISLWEFIVKRVFILSSIASEYWSLFGNGWVSEQNTVIAVNWR